MKTLLLVAALSASLTTADLSAVQAQDKPDWTTPIIQNYRHQAAMASNKIGLCQQFRPSVAKPCIELARQQLATATEIIKVVKEWNESLKKNDSPGVAAARLRHVDLIVKWEELARRDWVTDNFFHTQWLKRFGTRSSNEIYENMMKGGIATRDNFCPTLDASAQDECKKGWDDYVTAAKDALFEGSRRNKALDGKQGQLFRCRCK